MQRPLASQPLRIGDYLRRRFAHSKPCADLLDLRGLLFELGCESVYLFLLLRDRCLQLLDFVIEHGLRARGRLRWVHTIDAKLAESIHSNLTNGEAVPDLGERGDTTDKALGVRKHAADAYRAIFVGDGSTGEVQRASGIAEVNVIGASDRGLSCLETHGCVEIRVGIVQCRVTHCYVERATDVVKQRASTHGGVFESINVIEERHSANCRVDVADLVIFERVKADGGV